MHTPITFLFALIASLSAQSNSFSTQPRSSFSQRAVSNGIRSGSSSSCADLGNGSIFGGYKVSCSTDYPGGDLSNVQSSSFAGCATQCDNLQGCLGFAFTGGSNAGTCYFKSFLNGGSSNQNVDFGMRIASPGSCAATGSGTTSNGYKISCSTDFAGGDLSYAQSSNFAGCVTKCDGLQGCLGFSYIGGQNNGVCYFKSSQGKASSNSDVDSGFKANSASSSNTATLSSASSSNTVRSTPFSSTRTATSTLVSSTNTVTSAPSSSMNAATTRSVTSAKVTTTSAKTAPASSSNTATTTSKSVAPVTTSVKCPDSNGGNYISGGKTFRIDCATDYYGNDLSSIDVGSSENSFRQCIEACATNTGCASVNLSGSACYLKSAVGNSVANQGVAGARIIATSSTSSASSSSTFATSTSKSTSSAITSSGSPSSTRFTNSSSTVRPSSSTASSGTKIATTAKSTTNTSKVSSTSSKISSSATTSPSSASPVKNGGKRGLPYNNDTLTMPFSLSGQNSQVSWAYNWSPARQAYAPDYQSNSALTFFPTLFSDDPNAMATWPSKAQAAINAGADVLFSFNEPDFCIDGSACMAVNQSVNAYKSGMMPFAGKARLGAPAVTDQGGSGGLQYLEDFIGNCTGCQIDFINLHWYNNMYAYQYFKTYMTAAHKRFPDYPIYITEFGDNSNSGDAQTQTFLSQVMPWMDVTPWIERYSWFGNFPGFLINANGSGLSAQGSMYNSYSNPCANAASTSSMC